MRQRRVPWLGRLDWQRLAGITYTQSAPRLVAALMRQYARGDQKKKKKKVRLPPKRDRKKKTFSFRMKWA